MRFALGTRPGFLLDLDWQSHWAMHVARRGFWSVYSGDFSSREKTNLHDIVDYPPLLPLVDGALVRLLNVERRQDALRPIKELYGAFDVVLVGTLLVLLFRRGRPHAATAAYLLALNPAVAFNAHGWGQADAVLALELLLALVCVDRRSFVASFSLFSAAALTKPQGLIAAPIGAAVLAARGEWRALAGHAAAGLALFGLLEAAFHVFGGSSLLELYVRALTAFPVLSWSAFNLWWAAFRFHARYLPGSVHVGPASADAVGLALFLLSFGIGAWYLLRARKSLENDLVFAAWVSLALFLFPTGMHERYLYYPLVFLVVPSAGRRWLLGLGAVLSAVCYLNTTHFFRHYYPDQFPGWLVPTLNDWLQVGLARLALACGVAVAVALVRAARSTAAARAAA